MKSVSRRRRPLLPLAPPVVSTLRIVSLAWAIGAIVSLEFAARTGLLDHRPGFANVEITIRPVFVGLFAVGVVVAWWRPLLGGVTATFTVAGMLVWYARQLDAPDAAVVVGVFIVPGLAWLLLDLHHRRPRIAVAGLVSAAIAAAAGTVIATTTWDRLYGPTHPDSSASPRDDSPAEWIWTGAVTSTSAVVIAKPDREGPWSATVREHDSAEATGVATGRATGEVVRFEFTGLESDTTYEVVLSTEPTEPTEPTVTGRRRPDAVFTTFPDGSAPITIAVGSCARVGTNGAVFDAIADLEPTVFVEAGDFHYADISDDDPDRFRDVLDITLAGPGLSRLLRSVPVAYVWDDHDYGGNNSDASSESRTAASTVYRQYVPSYASPVVDEPINQAFDVGDVRVIMTDPRSAREPQRADGTAATMLGPDQVAWLERELLAARDTHSLTVWVSPVGWIGDADPSDDAWPGFAAERRRIAEFIVDHDIDRLVVVSGDAHMVAIDDGTNTGYADGGGPHFPVLHAGALDRPGRVKGGPYSEGAVPGGGQFGTIEIVEDTTAVHVTLRGRNWSGETLVSYRTSFDLD